MGKFEVKEVATGIKFNLKAGNGEIIGVSEVYKSASSCKNGIESVIKNAAIAGIADLTVDPVIEAKCPKFEIYLDAKKEYRFRLKARNGEIILASEGYKAKKSCENGIESVKKNAPDAKIEKI